MEVLKMVSKIALGSLLGLLIGTPVSRIMLANSQVPYLDQTKSNVVYDLKCLFGDEKQGRHSFQGRV